jgi:hypothetical protein
VKALSSSPKQQNKTKNNPTQLGYKREDLRIKGEINSFFEHIKFGKYLKLRRKV